MNYEPRRAVRLLMEALRDIQQSTGHDVVHDHCDRCALARSIMVFLGKDAYDLVLEGRVEEAAERTIPNSTFDIQTGRTR